MIQAATLALLLAAAPGAAKGFKIGDLVDIGATLTRYFGEAQKAGEPPTWEGLEQALRDKYEDIARQINAIPGETSIEVAVGVDAGDTMLADVRWDIVKENRTPAANLDLALIDSRFARTQIPTKFRVRLTGAYRLGLRHASDPSACTPAERMDACAFFTLDHMDQTSVTEERQGESDAFEPFPSGLPIARVSLGGLSFTATVHELHFRHRMEFRLLSPGGKKELSGAELVSGAGRIEAPQVSACTGRMTLGHDQAAGSLRLGFANEDVGKGPRAKLEIDGELRFGTVRIGGTTFSDALLTWSGSPDTAHVRGTVKGKAVSATYDLASRRLSGDVEGMGGIEVAGAPRTPER